VSPRSNRVEAVKAASTRRGDDREFERSSIFTGRQTLPDGIHWCHIRGNDWRRGGGSILNITAISAIQPIAGFGLSVASWAGVIGFAKTLSIEAAPLNISVNTLCPGYIDTKRLEKVFTGDDAQAMRRKLVAEIPMGRIGAVADVANLVAYLVSPLGRYVTGTTIQVDGGLLRALR